MNEDPENDPENAPQPEPDPNTVQGIRQILDNLDEEWGPDKRFENDEFDSDTSVEYEQVHSELQTDEMNSDINENADEMESNMNDHTDEDSYINEIPSASWQSDFAINAAPDTNYIEFDTSTQGSYARLTNPLVDYSSDGKYSEIDDTELENWNDTEYESEHNCRYSESDESGTESRYDNWTDKDYAEYQNRESPVEIETQQSYESEVINFKLLSSSSESDEEQQIYASYTGGTMPKRK